MAVFFGKADAIHFTYIFKNLIDQLFVSGDLDVYKLLSVDQIIVIII